MIEFIMGVLLGGLASASMTLFVLDLLGWKPRESDEEDKA